jgi:hypothetical protein
VSDRRRTRAIHRKLDVMVLRTLSVFAIMSAVAGCDAPIVSDGGAGGDGGALDGGAVTAVRTPRPRCGSFDVTALPGG